MAHLCVFPSEVVQVYLQMLWCQNTVLLTTTFFDVAKFTTLIPLSLQISCKLSYLIIGVKIYSLYIFVLKSPNKIFMLHAWNWSYTCSVLIKTIFHIILASVDACTYRIIPHQQPLSVVKRPIANKFYPLNCWYDTLMNKKVCP